MYDTFQHLIEILRKADTMLINTCTYHFYYILGANSGSLLHGDVSVMFLKCVPCRCTMQTHVHTYVCVSVCMYVYVRFNIRRYARMSMRAYLRACRFVDIVS